MERPIHNHSGWVFVYRMYAEQVTHEGSTNYLPTQTVHCLPVQVYLQVVGLHLNKPFRQQAEIAPTK